MKKILFLLSCLLLSSCWWGVNVDPNFVPKDIFFWNKDAAVQVVEYIDFQCPACARVESLIKDDLFENYVNTGKIGLTYKNFPLQFHSSAFWHALAAYCADEQWLYKEYSPLLYGFDSEAIISNKQRIAAAESIWIEKESFTKCLASQKYSWKIKRDIAEWVASWVQWTPSIFVNGTKISIKSKEDLFENIDLLLK